MHVVVNTRLLLHEKLDGIGWFSHEVLSRLVHLNPNWRFTFLFDRPFDNAFIYSDNVEGKVLRPPTRHPLLYKAYFDYSVPQYLKGSEADLFFSPDGFLSLKTKVKQVPVIHDINFEHRPLDLPKAYRNYYRKYFPRFAKRAHRIITVSEYSKQDISKIYGVDTQLIDVAYNGRNEAYQPLNEQQKKEAIQAFGKGQPYFVFVGNFSQRKNVHGIIQAFDAYKSQGGAGHLVLVGNPMWKYQEMTEALEASPNQSWIHTPGRLAIDQLVTCVGGATAMIFPSFFEGFGIPVAEAMAAGVPVITANNTSLPEVGGKAACLVEASDAESIAKHMLEIETSESRREEMIQLGLEHVSQFSWSKTAEDVNASLQRALNNT